MTELEQIKAAKQFAETWTNRWSEKSDAQMYWHDLLADVLGLKESFSDRVNFEKTVIVNGQTKFIDVYIPESLVLIEQKSLGKSLSKGITQSENIELTPFQQAKRYSDNLPFDEKPRWIIVSNFSEIRIHNMNTKEPEKEYETIALKDLPKEFHRLNFLVEEKEKIVSREIEISVKAGEIVGKIYDALLEQYTDKANPESLISLNKLCVRLVFCMYAEDSGLFGNRLMFHDYMEQYAAKDWRKALIDLFKILDTKIENRDPYLEEDLTAFPYVNGGLFAEESIEIPRITDNIRKVILENGCGFDWSEISPTIFGAVFESTLNQETRRKGGMHYTSIENIHKVIDPLFFDALKQELEQIKNNPIIAKRKAESLKFQEKLAKLKFLDPACGSGNFLTESYISLRKLENEAITLRTDGKILLGEILNPIKVSIHQFYGIEINDFAVTVAKTALWIAEHQMMKETENIVSMNLDFLPLHSYANIIEGNALHLDWSRLEDFGENQNQGICANKLNIQTVSKEEFEKIVGTHPNTLFDFKSHYDTLHVITPEVEISTDKPEPKIEPVIYDYIIGNPPFVGARLMSQSQKDDLLLIFGKKWKNIGNLDYVCGWYKKASDLIQNTNTKCALVSTNSVSQGETVANLWKPLFEDLNIQIDFAYKTFVWDSESFLKAYVHCVVIGFSCLCQGEAQSAVAISTKKKYIYDGDKKIEAKNINGYLIDAPNVFVESRKQQLFDVPSMVFGNMPNDGGNLILTEEEKDKLIKNDPKVSKFIKLFLGAEEFINNKKRYCLWLVDSNPTEFMKNKDIMSRIESVRKMRSESKRGATQKLADSPTLFGEIRQPIEGNYLLVPRVSSEKRIYVPIGFMSSNIIASDACQIIPNATLYHFGILTSSVHMNWMRAVCGRLKSDYRYSKDVVYNNFLWPTLTDSQKNKIEANAQAILDARAKYPDCSLADLYGENMYLFQELCKAHLTNDRVVLEAYGFDKNITESQIVAKLFELYEKKVKKS